jgi:hypothetical protein
VHAHRNGEARAAAEKIEVVNQIADFTVSQLQPVAIRHQRSGQMACVVMSPSDIPHT